MLLRAAVLFRALRFGSVQGGCEGDVAAPAVALKEWAAEGRKWWQTFGAEAPQLQSVSMKVLSKRSAAPLCEHLWPKFGAIWTDARSNLDATKAIRLLKLACNLHLVRKATDLSIDA